MLQQAVRSLARTPGFAVLSVLTMALGIAAATALFTIVDAVLLQPLAFPDPGRVVAINTSWPLKDHTTNRITGGDFLDLRSQAHSFSSISYYNGGDTELGVRLRAMSRFAKASFTDSSFFHVLGVQPILGRLPDASDADRSAVVSESFARANWTDDAVALGQTVTVENKPYTIIGVLPAQLAFPEKGEVWITTTANPDNQNRTAFNYRAIARLRRDTTLRQAQAELTAIGTRLQQEHPDSNVGKVFRVRSLQEQLTASVSITIFFLFGAAGLLLLISCANVTNLMLARTAARMREIAVRISLGSSTRAIVKRLLAEGFILGLGATLVGFLLAYIGVRASLPLLPSSLPRIASVAKLHPTVVAFCAAVSCLTVLVCSLLPAIYVRRVDLAEVLKQTPGRTVAGGAGRFRQGIVVAQIALCCMLCVSAALLGRTFVSLAHTPIGVQTSDVLVMYADAPAYRFPEYMNAIRTFQSALGSIRAIPGVRSAAAIMGLPTGRYGSNGSYLVEGVHVQAGQDITKMSWPQNLPEADFSVASPEYFKTVGIRLLSGRDFNNRDDYDAPFTAIISQALARQSFGSTNPLGRRIYCGLDSPKPMTIVGVVSDVRQGSPASAPGPEIYMPFQQHPYFANELELVIRTTSDPEQFVTPVRRTMQSVAPSVATNFITFSHMLDESIAAPRFRSSLALAFAALALLLALAGVYAVMSYVVSQRTTEMGVRMALGAGRFSILQLVSRQAFVLASVGLLAGLCGALLISRLAASLLFGIHSLDLASYLIAAAAVFFVVLAASSLPAWRAASVDPAIALRNE